MRGEIAPGVGRLAQRGPMSVSDSIVHFEVDGFTIAEIASALEISRTAANCRLRRARKQFRALVRDHVSHA
jgi:DNA-directed RNA polymerase specialized sigma24 family protein